MNQKGVTNPTLWKERAEQIKAEPLRRDVEWANLWGVSHERVGQIRVMAGLPPSGSLLRQLREAERSARAEQRAAAAATVRNRTHKPCSTCGAVKPLSDYPVSLGSADGTGSRCLPCGRDAAREWTLTHRNRTPEPVVLTQPCRTCGQTLPASSFHRDTRSLTGLARYCKSCHPRLAAGESVAQVAESYGITYRRTRRASG